MNANLYHGDAVVATSKQPSFSTGTSASGENCSKIQDGGYPSRRIYASTLDSNPPAGRAFWHRRDLEDQIDLWHAHGAGWRRGRWVVNARTSRSDGCWL